MPSNRQKTPKSGSADNVNVEGAAFPAEPAETGRRAGAAAKRAEAARKAAPVREEQPEVAGRKPKWVRPISSSAPSAGAVGEGKPIEREPPPAAGASPTPAPTTTDSQTSAPIPASSETPPPAPAPASASQESPKAAEAASEAPLQAVLQEPAKAPETPPAVPAKAETSAQAQTTSGAPAETKGPGSSASGEAVFPVPDAETLAHNISQAIEHAGKVFAAYMRPREAGEIKTTIADDIGEMVKSLGHVAEYYMRDPARAFEAQTALTTQFIDLWAETLKRFHGAPARPVAEPDRSDKRFSHADWRDNPVFDFIKQAYCLTSRWADDLVRRADDLEAHQRKKAQFYLRQVVAALSPTNFIGTNPELIRATIAESGENLVRGLKMLAEDIEAGKGHLRIRQSDARAFKLGVNLAATPGKVVFRNDLIELIQYEPTTAEVCKRPLLIVPPWINKFYILDLNPEKSFIRWAVAQGLTVFVISWVNPDERLAHKGFEAYMREGVLTALDCVEKATGERDIAAIGYCVGGTLLAAALGYMAAIGDARVRSATFFTSLVDFTDAGELQIFVDAEQLKALEERMAAHGYLEGSAMANTFNMLRPNDLIWSYYVNNYLKGKEPMPFDLLVWNSDATRMPAANHNFYLRHCYYQNDLSSGRMVLDGQRIDLKKVTIPIYELASREDHIAPARGVFRSAQCFGGPVRFVMAGSGHIAGVVNPPDKPKYQHWTDGPPQGEFEAWVANAKETPGSWWPDWIAWISAQAPDKVPAREPGGGKLEPIGDAPGEYVRVKA